MAEKSLVPVELFSNCRSFKWANLTSGDTGAALKMPSFSDRTIHIFGDFNSASASASIEGSNDPRVESDPANANWQPFTDPQGNALNSITAARMEQLMENPVYIRPKAGGTGGDLTFILTIRK